MKKPTFDLWYFEWWDATSVDAWTDIYEAMEHRTHTIRTVGYLINEDEETLCVAMNYDAEGETCSCIMHIPKSIVTRRHRLLIDAKLDVPIKKSSQQKATRQ